MAVVVVVPGLGARVEGAGRVALGRLGVRAVAWVTWPSRVCTRLGAGLACKRSLFSGSGLGWGPVALYEGWQMAPHGHRKKRLTLHVERVGLRDAGGGFRRFAWRSLSDR